MITRSRHLRSSTAPQEKPIDNDDEKQAIPIYDAIANTLHKWNVLALSNTDEFTFEPVVVRFVQHLPEVRDLSQVEYLVVEIFAEKQGYTKFSPEQSLLMKFLADEVWSAWTAYLQRNEPSNFAQTRSRARMMRFSTR